MRFHFGAAAFFLFFIFGIQKINGRAFEEDCQKFVGKVVCENGDEVLSTASVTVWKLDLLGVDDKPAVARIASDGHYEILGCAIPENYGMRLSLEFNNVCFNGQSHRVAYPKPNSFQFFILINENESNGMTLQNISRSDSTMLGGRRNKMLKSYPPMPRPKHHRRRQQQNLSMDISDEKKNHARLRTKRKRLPKGNYTFNGKVNCQKSHYGTTIGTVKLMEHDYFSDDDVIAVSKIQANGEFIVGGYADDGKMFSSVHLYLLFENVCVQGDSSEVWDAKPNHYYTFSIN